jgi:hypothetical protein
MNAAPNHPERTADLKARINAEFDRVARSFHAAAQQQSGRERQDTVALLEILEEHRAAVLANTDLDYFLDNWSNPQDQVRRLLAADPRAAAIRAAR